MTVLLGRLFGGLLGGRRLEVEGTHVRSPVGRGDARRGGRRASPRWTCDHSGGTTPLSLPLLPSALAVVGSAAAFEDRGREKSDGTSTSASPSFQRRNETACRHDSYARVKSVNALARR